MADLTPPELILDNYQQLMIDSLVHTNIVSGGEFTDIDPAGFMAPFAGTMSYVGSELLYKANLASIAAAKSFITNVLGVPDDQGVKTIIEVQFGLTTALSTNFIVPSNFQISDSSGLFRFYTIGNLIIPSGAIYGTIQAIAEEADDKYNISAGFINTFSQPLTYLSYVINTTTVVSGRDAQPVEDLIEKSAQSIRNRNPVSALDFEELSVAIMGVGSRAKCIGLLGLNKLIDDPQPGVVHLFLLDTVGKPTEQGTMSTVGNTISPRLMLGTRLLISPMEQLEISIDVIANSTGLFTMQELSDRLWDALLIYFNSSTYPIGDSGAVILEEVKFILRSVTGVIISYVTINQDPLNIPMPNNWTQVKLTGLNIELVDSQGVIFRDNHFIVTQDD